MAFITGIKLFLPMIMAMALLISSSVPIYIAGASAFFPAVDIMVIYYWSGYRPSAIPDWFIFLLGAFRDVIEGITIGTSPFIYLTIKFIVVASRGLYRKESFPVIWQGFAVITVIAIAGRWLLVSFVIDTPIALDYAIMQFLFSIATYPAIHWFFNIVSITMPESHQDA